MQKTDVQKAGSQDRAPLLYTNTRSLSQLLDNIATYSCLQICCSNRCEIAAKSIVPSHSTSASHVDRCQREQQCCACEIPIVVAIDADRNGNMPVCIQLAQSNRIGFSVCCTI